MLMGDPPKIVIRDPSSHHAEVLKELSEIALPHGGVDLNASFGAVAKALESSDIPQKEIVILTDLQTASWKPKTAVKDDDSLKRALKKLDAFKPRSIVIDLGNSSDKNIAITDLRLERPIVTVGKPAPVRVTLRNFNGDPDQLAHVKLMIDGQFGPEEDVVLPLGQDVSIDFSPTFSSPGDHLIEARIDPDALPLDDRRFISAPVREYLRVLLVDGDFKPEPYKAETDLLSQALTPESDSDGSPSIIHCEVASESQLLGRDLNGYDAVALCNVARFSDAEVSALESYLAQGGGVVVFGGDQVEAENYNRYLYKDGKGFLPVQLGPSVGSADSRETVYTFNPLNFKHPIVEQFSGAQDEVIQGLTNVITRQYHKLILPPNSSAKTALAFSSGDPAIVEANWKKGKVFVVATTADLGWSGWPVHYSYPAVMEEMFLQAAEGRLAQHNVAVGQPLDQSFGAAGLNVPATVTLPDNKTAKTKLTGGEEGSKLHFEQTDLSGAYRVQVGPPIDQESTFAANGPAAESNPAKLDRLALADTLSGWNFAYYTNLQELISNPAAVSQRGELHRPLLYAVLVLLFVESILAWFFGHHAGPARAARAR